MDNYERFLRIGGKDFPLSEVLEKLSCEKDSEVVLCQRIPAGILMAKGSAIDGDPYPAIDVELEVASGDAIPFAISRTDQAVVTGQETPVRTFLYDRESYIAYTDADTRSDEEWENHPRQLELVVSGDKGCPEQTVHVYSENSYVKYMGELPADKQEGTV